MAASRHHDLPSRPVQRLEVGALAPTRARGEGVCSGGKRRGRIDQVGRLTATLVLLFALAKAWVISREFMRLHSAPAPIRLAFDAWVVLFAVVCGSLAFL